MDLQHLHDSATSLINEARNRDVKICTVESCTGGLIAATLTEIPGASDVLCCGAITYSNESKTRIMGVPPEIIEQHGAVSESVACMMAENALERAPATLSVSVTGIAGPGGGTEHKPVGLVHMATKFEGYDTIAKHFHFKGDRHMVRAQAVEAAIQMLRDRIL
ncbi:MAG: CinA family protein [Rickettsiales bacterium]|nr:CinA family protein [Rickettsiales bacterium]